MNYVAGAAGATLGYIVGDVPGAIAGYGLGARGYKWSSGGRKSLPKMQPTPPSSRKRKSRYATPARVAGRVRRRLFAKDTPNKRRRMNPKKKKRTTTGGVVKVDTRDPAVYKKGRVINRKQRKVKVGKLFKKKVQQVQRGYLPKGTYESIHFGQLNVNKSDRFIYNTGNVLGYRDQPFGVGFAVLPLAVTCKKFLYGAINSDQDFTTQAFHIWEIVLQHALVWFNVVKRASTATPASLSISERLDTVKFWREAFAQGTPNIPLNWISLIEPLLQSKIDVINMYRNYTVRNNSTRTMSLVFWDCVPKCKMDVGSSFYADWLGECQKQAAAGPVGYADPRYNAVSYLGQNQAFPELQTAGILGNGVTTLNPHNLSITPYLFPQLLKRWKISKKTVLLEPGQSYVHFVQGPKNCIINPRSYTKPVIQGPPLEAASSTNTQQTSAYNLLGMHQYTPYVGVDTLIQVTPDLQLYEGVASIIPLSEEESVDKKFGIAVKCSKYASFRMPDQAGFDQSFEMPGNSGPGVAAVNTQMLNKRKSMHYRVVWDRVNNEVIDENLIDRIDPINPQAPVVDT